MVTDHSERKHALLSASGATRWINCPPSARLEEEVGEKESSVFAEEGTLAHEFGDIALQQLSVRITKAARDKREEELRAHKLYTDEMEGEVEKYTSYVMEEYNAAKKRDKNAVLLIEEKVDLTEFIEDGFGTCDANIIAEGTLEVIDLKYGKGVRVNANGNDQLGLYALGAVIKYDLTHEIDKVKLTIVQPRLDHISSWTLSVKALEAWASNVVAPAAALAYKGEGVQKAGEHCRWCEVKPQCRAMRDYTMDLGKHDFAEPHLLTEEGIIEAYEKVGLIEKWAKSVADYMLEEAKSGRVWKGYKVVEGRSQRKWIDDAAVLEKLKKSKYKLGDITQTKLLGITKIEKLMGQAKFVKSLGSLVIKPQGAPTLAPEDDKRPALGIAQADDFSDNEVDDLL